MRVGILVPEFPGQTHIMFWREIVALRAVGCFVQILSTRPGRPGACTHDFASSRHGAIYCWPPSLTKAIRASSRSPRGVLRALRYLARIRRSGSIVRRLGLWAAALDLSDSLRRLQLGHVHAHTCADGAHVLAMASLITGVPYSLQLHGDLDAYGADHAAKFAGARFVVADSRRHIEEAARRGVLGPVKHGCLPMGVDLSRVVVRQQPDHGPLRIITVARLHPCKGHEVVLEALGRCRDRGVEFIYTIVGEGDHRPTIERKIAGLNLDDKVVMAGALDSDGVAETLAQQDLFVLPSVGIGEAAPVSVMEAMAAGLAIVCSRIGDTEDMVRDGLDGFLTEKGDSVGVASAIERLASDRSLLNRIGDSARKRAFERFDSRQQATSLLQWIAGEASRVSG